MKSEGHTSEDMAPIVHTAKVLAINSDTDDDNSTGNILDRECQAQIEERQKTVMKVTTKKIISTTTITRDTSNTTHERKTIVRRCEKYGDPA